MLRLIVHRSYLASTSDRRLLLASLVLVVVSEVVIENLQYCVVSVIDDGLESPMLFEFVDSHCERLGIVPLYPWALMSANMSLLEQLLVEIIHQAVGIAIQQARRMESW